MKVTGKGEVLFEVTSSDTDSESWMYPNGTTERVESCKYRIFKNKGLS